MPAITTSLPFTSDAPLRRSTCSGRLGRGPSCRLAPLLQAWRTEGGAQGPLSPTGPMPHRPERPTALGDHIHIPA